MERIQIVLLVINEKHLDLTIDSLKKQTVSKDSINVTFVDTLGSDSIKAKYDLLSETFECKYILAAHGLSQGLSSALHQIQAQPFLICLSGTEYSENALNAAAEKISQGNELVSLNPRIISHLSSRLAASLVEKADNFISEKLPEGTVKFCEHISSVHLSIDSYMFGSSFVKYLEVSDQSGDECVHMLLLTLLSHADSYYYLPQEAATMYSAQLITYPDYPNMREKWWYSPFLNNILTPFIKKLHEENRLSDALQYSLAALVLWRFLANYEEKNLGVLSEKTEIEELYAAAGKALLHIRNDIILKWCSDNRWAGRGQDKKVKFHRAIAFKILRFKAQQIGGTLEITNDKHYLYAKTPNESPVQVCRASQETLDITVINYENDHLEIDAVFSMGDILDADNISIWAECNGERIEIEHSPVYPLIKCFGVTIAHRYPIKLSIPAAVGSSISFFFSIDHVKHSIKLTFDLVFSRLVTDKNSAYWIFKKGHYLCCTDSRVLNVKKLNALSHFAKEIKLLFSMLSYHCPSKVMLLGSIAVRCLYWLTKPFYGKKKRWVTFDKLYKGGDNGEYFFRYSASRKDKVKVYYIINKDAKEYKELKKKYKYVLKSISLRTILTVLNSEAIAATHSTIISYLGFPLSSRPFLRDLFNFKVCCIQHGLTVQQLAQYQNRTFDNTTLYCLASHFEHENLMKPIYGFDEKHLKMTGLARFDGLKNDDRKFLLITPTWRRNVVAGGIANIKKSHVDGFKGTEYYRLYNNLINDSRLIECAKKYGYGITYLLHPAMSAQIDDYDRNDFVQLVPATGNMNYEEILTQASLMLTDYSGVQFDFAYMRKPVVYYHPDTLPPQYESGSIDYPTTGFGPICTDHESLIDTLCAYMENNCANTEQYIARADAFFAFSDYDSCRRIYDEMLEFTK